MKALLLGTRGSALALAQTEIVKGALAAACTEVQVDHRVIRTTGDIRLDVKLNEPGTLDKGLFTKELEEELLRGTIHAAVHSLKDLPTALPEGLILAVTLARAPIADVLICKSPLGLHGIARGGIIATSSERRKRFLQWMRPDLEIIAIRGNVPTRLRKLAESAEWGGIILAQAGLERLGYDVDSGHVEAENISFFAMPIEEMLPAPGQGAIALEARADDAEALQILRGVNHEETFACVSAERALLHATGGGCHMPLGARATVSGDALVLEAALFLSEEKEPRRASAIGKASEPERVADEVYRKLYQ